MMSLSVCTICQDEEEPIKWYLEYIAFLSEQLGDVLREVVLVDGGSKDNTIDVINSYKDKAPIKLLERPWDYPANQMNFGLEHCTGDYVFTLDADMTATTNFPDLFKNNYFQRGDYWDFPILFTGKDAYHFFHKWPRGVNIRMHKRGPKWTRKYHVLLEGQTPGIPVCVAVTIFENSCRIKSVEALMHRGERRQADNEGMVEEGGGPGPVNRFYGAAQAAETDTMLISDYKKAVANLILPSTNG